MQQSVRFGFMGMVMLISTLMFSCNKSEEITTPGGPKIAMDDPTGIYQVKVGKPVTITPTVENDQQAIYSWKIAGKMVGTTPTYTFTSPNAGEYFITLRVDTPYGHDELELRVDVLEKTPPVVALSIPSQGFLTAITGQELKLAPAVKHSQGASYTWSMGGKEVGTDSVYLFREEALGDYALTLTVSNEDGEDQTEATVRVVPTPELSLTFGQATVSVPLGRTLILAPSIMYATEQTTYAWSIDNVVQPGENGHTLTITPSAKGTISIKIIGTTGEKVSTGSVSVLCVDPEGTHFRPSTAASNALCNNVFEFLPAPGQFVNEGYTVTTMAQACAWAKGQLDKEYIVSLGGFGGSIVVGFDHSIVNKANNAYDFSVTGNSFAGSSEPGIVWVMQDENGDGKPNDTWYQLQGSESAQATTIQNYAVTYYRPKAAGMDVQWSDNRGAVGRIDYLVYHTQPYYYPAWVSEDTYTLSGTCLGLRNTQDPNTGFWDNEAYAWGYADNFGSDRPDGSGDNAAGGANANLFKIENAVQANGTPVTLQYIDFIKVQCAINGKSGWLGELSTEVVGFKDLNIAK